MKAARITLHLVTMAAVLYCFGFWLLDLWRTHDKQEWFLCASLLPLFFAGYGGLILEFRKNRFAAWVNPAIPLLFAGVLVLDEFLFGEAEAFGFALIFALIPICVAAIQGVLYYMAWQTGWFQE